MWIDRIVSTVGLVMCAVLGCIIVYGLFLDFPWRSVSKPKEGIKTEEVAPEATENDWKKVRIVPTFSISNLDTKCIDGVLYFFVYLQGIEVILTPKFDKNSKIVLCP